MRTTMMVLASTVALATLVGGCVFDDDCPGEATATVEALVPQGADVHCEAARDFEIDGRTVTFTRVEYGERRDCPSGCFSSNLCGIEDGDGVELYHANWYEDAEAPRGIDEECPDLERQSTTECDTSGKNHPLTETDRFQNFKEQQPMENGPFRFCF